MHEPHLASHLENSRPLAKYLETGVDFNKKRIGICRVQLGRAKRGPTARSASQSAARSAGRRRRRRRPPPKAAPPKAGRAARDEQTKATGDQARSEEAATESNAD